MNTTEITWLSDLILRESGLMSTLQLRGSSKKLIGFCKTEPKFQISHQYDKKDKIKSILNIIKAAKDRYAGMEINLNMLKDLSNQFGKDNAVSKWLNEKSDESVKFINDIIGKSSNYENYRNLANTVQYWLDTQVNVTIPTFTAIFLPNPLTGEDPVVQAKEYIDLFGGKSGPANPKDISSGSKFVTDLLSKQGIYWKAGWYKYMSPNGYGPDKINRSNPKDISGTFILKTNDNYTYNDLLINSLNVSMSDVLIKEGSYDPYPTWIKFEISFLRAVEYTAKDAKVTFNLSN